ncbi:maleylpyruvate isomerase N-terminal domain-containing protein [Nocardioides bizhenqiangii]|uniref:Maleylpyruvate isomerase N-terminal domain-containing protein n=1 Tax=Nocardioides bizhenqiangii TaxID=3095076 RepID=A0ABZ0ZWH8_9ACTN|nr:MULTISPECIES: maleylpyruvate isomerase N-terminal domain-containing protein [unclassified Nocardioides]MDZ5622145.1 maleylpyruvate isomerase N-terminal domain-containing protein [Nocardioides sp. HM23]WQQ28674.1 maleylpyruvate isomerase N-terminal domain-containing protein [Nocardioides sp. HM61]
MTRLDHSEYLDHIRRDSARFREVLAACDPAAPVPSCPEWSAADLLWHLTTVQHSWWAVVVNRPQSREEMGYTEPDRPEGYDALLAAFDDAHGAFAAALEAADPAEPAWSWSSEAADQTVAFTYRRQAHEALIHRVDAELTAGALTSLDPALAADGVDEALDKMYGALPSWGRFEPQPRYIEFRIADFGTSVWTQLGTFSGTAPDGEEFSDEQDMHVVADPGVPPDAVVAGDAAVLDSWLWHRGDEAGIAISGDTRVIEHARAVLGNPIA